MFKRTDLDFTLQNCSQNSHFYEAQINIQQTSKDLTRSVHLERIYNSPLFALSEEWLGRDTSSTFDVLR
jgi:hypothetical protein